VAISIAVAALAQAAIASPPAAEQEPEPKRGHKRLIALGVAVVVLMISAVLLRNSSLGERFTGHGYDSNPLPPRSFPMPSFTGADYTLTHQMVAIDNGLATNFWTTEHDEVNFSSKQAKATVDLAKATIIGGTIGTPQSTSPSREVVMDEQSMYVAGATTTDPWTRIHRIAGVSSEALNKSDLYMYQDVIDPALRNRHPDEVVDEVRHGVAVTTYTYKLAFGDFYESAPRLFDLVRMMDGNAADDAGVTVTISLDDQWMVRYLDVDVDHASVLAHRAKLDVGTKYPYRFTLDVTSITQKPPAIVIPTKVVDAPVTTPSTTVSP
jgi:hypothetical protein